MCDVNSHYTNVNSRSTNTEDGAHDRAGKSQYV